MLWVRSSFCSGGQCVEVGEGGSGGNVLMRDGKLGDASPLLSFSPQAWAAFLDSLPELDAQLR